ncbi:ribbon-helix-helix domain-containing protein [Azospirillum sp. RWY-5-1]|uniref:Ribbon-helix-helix domain-containing protein n=1 Tax=Azospirillum oleiclasticum TaxID=2735135 RepID=A0ABX2TFD7_9PROT|nr:ribbon-helix-helix domain-containing protein [Azospirillum oleiclasticum]NYZ16921.1 ribbon-helix-helix domain-containing protein [Azospirillum oleiclasticum]NYZ21858.1 ribbon-helix-helix domain-containing protein [Azospirillum oleiclasticum]
MAGPGKTKERTESVGGRRYPSWQVCRNVVVTGRRTTVRMEAAFWDGLAEIGRREGLELNQLCSLVDRRRGGVKLTPALRMFVVGYFRVAVPGRLPPPAEAARTSPLFRSALGAIG